MKLNQIECKSCGAHIKVKEDDENVVCPYCGNTYSVSEEKRKLRKQHNKVIIPVIIVAVVGIFITAYMVINIGLIGSRNVSTENGLKQQVENKIDEQKIKAEVDKFNFGYRNETTYGSIVWSTLDKVITNNKTNKKRLITVKYNDIQTSDPEEITQLKKKLDKFTQYEVKLDYDDDGFINLITIEDFK